MLPDDERNLVLRYAEPILDISETKLGQEITKKGRSEFRDGVLGMGEAEGYSRFYAPFGWINRQADVVLVGITPGAQQAAEALVVLRRALLAGKSPEEAAERAKQAASFKGTMRTLGARLMDHFGIHQLLDLSSTIDLFGSASGRAHYTSAMRYPVLKGYANYSGDSRMMQRKFLRDAVVESLPSEIEHLQNPWIIPFGSAAASALEYLVEQGRLSDDRILSGILHPSGTQWNRYNVQLNLVTNQEATMVPGGSDVIARSAKLRQKVATAIANRDA